MNFVELTSTTGGGKFYLNPKAIKRITLGFKEGVGSRVWVYGQEDESFVVETPEQILEQCHKEFHKAKRFKEQQEEINRRLEKAFEGRDAHLERK